MFDDMGEGGVDEKITDYVDRGRGHQKVDMFPLKSGLYHQCLESKAYVLFYFYIPLILYYNIQVRLKNNMVYHEMWVIK